MLAVFLPSIFVYGELQRRNISFLPYYSPTVMAKPYFDFLNPLHKPTRTEQANPEI